MHYKHQGNMGVGFNGDWSGRAELCFIDENGEDQTVSVDAESFRDLAMAICGDELLGKIQTALEDVLPG
jgi:hypothetical protein